eukprot:5986615-Prymnesium_polylepis.1
MFAWSSSHEVFTYHVITSSNRDTCIFKSDLNAEEVTAFGDAQSAVFDQAYQRFSNEFTSKLTITEGTSSLIDVVSLAPQAFEPQNGSCKLTKREKDSKALTEQCIGETERAEKSNRRSVGQQLRHALAPANQGGTQPRISAKQKPTAKPK